MVAYYEQRITQLEAEVRELTVRLNQNSQNSSKPPSSDGPHVKRKPPRPWLPLLIRSAPSTRQRLVRSQGPAARHSLGDLHVRTRITAPFPCSLLMQIRTEAGTRPRGAGCQEFALEPARVKYALDNSFHRTFTAHGARDLSAASAEYHCLSHRLLSCLFQDSNASSVASPTWLTSSFLIAYPVNAHREKH